MHRISPGRLALGLALFAGSGIAALALTVVFAISAFSALTHVDSPGSANIHLKTGSYTVYWESPALLKKGVRPPDVLVRVDPKDGDPPVNLRAVGDFVTRYSTFDTAGSSIFDFSIGRDGDYEISVTAPQKLQQHPGRISLCRSISLAAALRIVLVPLLLSVGGTVAAFFVVLKGPKTPVTPA